jgi:sulfur carrier protein
MDEADLIDVLLDGRSYSVPGATTLAALVESLGHQQDKVTTAVNGLFVRRDARHDCMLQPGDAVLMFQPITGG